MAGRIPREFIDDLIARSDIVDIIDARVKLKKAGRNYQACCPFHNEKSPSFSVAPDKQFYHCFGCGAHGNVISFLMDYDRLEFVEAIEELARTHGIDVPREQHSNYDPSKAAQKKQQADNDFELMEQACKLFQVALRKHPDHAQVIDYLKQRGLSGEIAKAWEIGFAPDEWQYLSDALATNPQRSQQCLDLKLTTENERGKRYDFFRGRLMFPIRDRRGRVIGFGGRVMQAEQSPKYLNSPETRIFHKGSELYGLHRARTLHRSLKRLVVVEGYMDVVALSQYEIDYAVASLGTATTPDHVQLMFRNTDEIVCCYDGDNAGRKAAWRTLENALPMLQDGKQIKFMFLPDGEDPDTMVRQIGKEAMEDLFQQAQPLSQFMFEHLLKEHSVTSTEGKAALKKVAQPLIDSILGTNQKELLTSELSRICGEHDKYQIDRDIKSAQSQRKPKKDFSKGAQKLEQSPVRMLIRLLLEAPQLATDVQQVQPQLLVTAGFKGWPIFMQLHAYCVEHPNANTGMLFEAFKDHDASPHLTALMQQECLVNPEDYDTVYADAFSRLIQQYLKGRADELLAKSRHSQLTLGEKEELRKLLAHK
ncbi:DNA primase [Alteromonas sp. LMIT006]|jgi:DNA primase|uniref:DNA primase n=1 Tax=Alteromonadaceae TaxID=72275 RepID=UPI0020CA40A3|nr:DNA primase [Alteromonas sp. LMIT006]UTP73612.1 DNA primase [Alteromonas sp. LMIT006]